MWISWSQVAGRTRACRTSGGVRGIGMLGWSASLLAGGRVT